MALLPKLRRDPTGTDALERKAMSDMNARIIQIRKRYRQALLAIPVETYDVKANWQLAPNAKRYQFRLEPWTLDAMLADLDAFVDGLMLEGGRASNWFHELYVSVAYQRGAAQQLSNLSAQSPAYRKAIDTLQTLVRSEPYQRRLMLLAAREFEEMQGLAGNIKANMSRVLVEGMATGRNPRDIAKQITEQAGIERRRANRIARTEIPTALRRARLDEAEDAIERYDLRSKEMHYSALSPTTRATHAARHGKLFTVDQQRDWWARDGNSINCKCTTITVLVDERGQPLFKSIVERARRAKE